MEHCTIQSTLRCMLRHSFHGTRLPDDFVDCHTVVVCFHGWSNSSRDAMRWPIQCAFPRGCCFLFLNAPIAHDTHGYQWFPYCRESAVDVYDVETADLKDSVDGMMRAMNLHARAADVLHTVRLVIRLVELIAATRRDFYLVGDSQGAAVAFTAALYLMKADADHTRMTDRFRGGFFHHMAGVYPGAFPRALVSTEVARRLVLHRSMQDDTGRRNPRMRRGLDLHGVWLPEEVWLLADVVTATLTPAGSTARLVVALSVHDHTVPMALHRHLVSLFPARRTRTRKSPLTKT